jgi:hypothetical protein
VVLEAQRQSIVNRNFTSRQSIIREGFNREDSRSPNDSTSRQSVV